MYIRWWQHPKSWWNPHNLHLRKVCNGQGPDVCRTDYETSCTTRLVIYWPSWVEMPSIAHYVSLSNPAPCPPTGTWSRLQASLLVTQNVRRWECYILWGQRKTSSWAHPQVWNGRNQLAHGLTFLSKVPLEVCGQGCVTEEAPEEWSSFNSSHAFVPLCICASFHLSLFRTKGQQTPSEYYQL